MLAFHRPLHTSCPARLGRRIHRCDAPASRRPRIHDSPDFASAHRLGGGRHPAALHPTQLRVFGPTWRPLAIGIYASSTTMGPQLAASIDAWIVQRYGWTAVLWASLAPGLVSFATGF